MAEVPTQESDEQALIRRIRTGDRDALAALHHLYRPRIGRFLLRMGLPEQDHDTVVNDVLYTAWTHADRFDPVRSRLSTWLFGIARNKALKTFNRNRTPIAEPEQVEELAEWRNDIESLETRQWIAFGLASLPSEQRMVLELTFLEGLTYAEISEVLDIPVNTVKTRVFHARRKLRNMLPTDELRLKTNEEHHE